jgi:hypothetical protein
MSQPPATERAPLLHMVLSKLLPGQRPAIHPGVVQSRSRPSASTWLLGCDPDLRFLFVHGRFWGCESQAWHGGAVHAWPSPPCHPTLHVEPFMWSPLAFVRARLSSAAVALLSHLCAIIACVPSRAVADAPVIVADADAGAVPRARPGATKSVGDRDFRLSGG